MPDMSEALKDAGGVRDTQAHWLMTLQALKCDPSAGQLTQLQDYFALLQRWNKVHNLSAIREPEKMLAVHLWDSLSVKSHLNQGAYLDMGSGGGLPGIPLAIMSPDSHFTLVDSRDKKTLFLQQVVLELSLENVEVVQRRLEEWQEPPKFDYTLSRAFAALKDFVSLSEPFLKGSGTCYAMKGKYPQQELDELPTDWQLIQCHSLTVPDLDAERHLLVLERDT